MTNLLQSVIDAVRSCRAVADAPFSVTEKDSLSNIVTTADRRVEQYLRTRLLEILPQAGFLGEEGTAARGGDYLFVVDPIDGTSNFVRRIPQSAVSVGLLYRGRGLLGVVMNLFTGELFYAQAGCGAFRNGQPIRVSDRDFAHSMFYTALSTYRREYSSLTLRVLEQVFSQCDDFRREGCASLELCRLAAGGAELYFEARLYPWDVCAGQVILQEAGGCFCNLYTPDLCSPRALPVVAANSPENLQKLLAIVQAELPCLPEGYN